MADMVTPKPRQPKGTPRHEIGWSHTPTQQPDKYVKVFDMVSKDFDEKMAQQQVKEVLIQENLQSDQTLPVSAGRMAAQREKLLIW